MRWMKLVVSCEFDSRMTHSLPNAISCFSQLLQLHRHVCTTRRNEKAESRNEVRNTLFFECSYLFSCIACDSPGDLPVLPLSLSTRFGMIWICCPHESDNMSKPDSQVTQKDSVKEVGGVGKHRSCIPNIGPCDVKYFWIRIWILIASPADLHDAKSRMLLLNLVKHLESYM